MKRRHITVLLITFIVTSCTIGRTWFKPKEFTYQYEQEYTGLDNLININGYFLSDINIGGLVGDLNRVMFYQDGIVCFPDIEPIKEVYDKTMYSSVVGRQLWGTYRLKDDTITTQVVMDLGLMSSLYISKHSFLIKSRDEILLLSKNRQGTDTTYSYKFNPLETRVDSTNWLMKKKWFYKKGYR